MTRGDSRERLRAMTVRYAACHLVIDLACVATVLGLVAPTYGADVSGVARHALAVLVYDMLAFCLQLPVGALLDVLGRRWSRGAGALSAALVAAGVLCGLAGGVLRPPAVALVAVGNALFHCVGGVEVLGESQGRAAPAGEFISTGAIGVFVGSMDAFSRWVGAPWLLLALLAGAAVLMAGAPASRGEGCLSCDLRQRDWVAVLLLAATVALRSYAGMVMGFPWKATPVLAAVAIGCVVCGKAAGGRVADRLGAPLASLMSLGGSAVLFLPSWGSVPAGLAAALLFNFTMAITLSALAALFPRAQGMAFGIASFSLAIGALPALLGVRTASAMVLCALALASLVLLELALLLMQAGGRTGREVTVRPQAVRRP